MSLLAVPYTEQEYQKQINLMTNRALSFLDFQVFVDGEEVISRLSRNQQTLTEEERKEIKTNRVSQLEGLLTIIADSNGGKIEFRTFNGTSNNPSSIKILVPDHQNGLGNVVVGQSPQEVSKQIKEAVEVAEKNWELRDLRKAKADYEKRIEKLEKEKEDLLELVESEKSSLGKMFQDIDPNIKNAGLGLLLGKLGGGGLAGIPQAEVTEELSESERQALNYITEVIEDLQEDWDMMGEVIAICREDKSKIKIIHELLIAK